MVTNFGNDVTLAPAGTVVTATGTGSVVLEPINKGNLRALLDVTALSGTTPSLTVTVETSYDKGVTDAWHSAGAFTAATTVSKQRKIIPIDRYVRISYVVSGTTPSITFGVFGETV
jgi:hypothetical protein